MDPGLAIQEFLEYVVASLVEHPDEAAVERLDREGVTSFRISLHPEDAGRVIGKGGKTIQAIQSLVQASGEKFHIQAEVEVSRDARA